MENVNRTSKESDPSTDQVDHLGDRDKIPIRASLECMGALSANYFGYWPFPRDQHAFGVGPWGLAFTLNEC